MSKKFKVRPHRRFTVEMRKRIVKEVETCELSVLQASKEYEVSQQCIYNWLYKYSRYLQKQAKMVVEEQSEEKRRIELKKEKEELERIIGQKQLKIDYLEKIIELAGKELGLDIKKNFGSK